MISEHLEFQYKIERHEMLDGLQVTPVCAG